MRFWPSLRRIFGVLRAQGTRLVAEAVVLFVLNETLKLKQMLFPNALGWYIIRYGVVV